MGSEPVKLFPKELDTLLVLVQRHGKIVGKDELLDTVWPGVAVEEGNLTTHVSHLRKLLGGTGTNRDYIATIPGRGYKFVADVIVEAPSAEQAPVALPAPTAARPSAPATSSRRLWIPLVALTAAVVAGLALFSTRDVDERRPSYPPLTFGTGTIWSVRFAPDGETVVYGAAWDGRPIELFSTRVGSTESRSLGHQADILSISPSGEMAVMLNRRLVRTWDSFGRLARLSLAGGAPREIQGAVKGADWSPDGRELAVVQGGPSKSILQYPAGKTIYEVDGFIMQPRFSRKGDAIAFLQRNAGNESVQLVTLDGVQKTLVSGLTDVTGLAWSSTGDEVLFTVTKQGSTELRAVKDSRPSRLVTTKDGEWTLHDIAPNGRVLMTLDHKRGYIFGAARGDATARNLSWLDRSIATDLSADGQLLLLGEIGAGGGQARAVYSRKMDGSPAIRLGDGEPYALSRDGKWVIALRGASPERLVLLPTGPGKEKLLESGGITDYTGVNWFPDNRRILIAAKEQGARLESYMLDTATPGSKPVAWKGPAAASIVFFNDATRYVARAGGLSESLQATARDWYIFDIENRVEPQPVPNIATGERVIQVAVDGQSLFVLLRTNGKSFVIERLDLSTGRRTPWKTIDVPDPAGVMLPHPGFIPFLMSQDGGTYVYSYLRVLSTLYVFEDLK